MIIKSSTALCNDYSMISDLAHEKADSARNITNLILDSRLELFPLSGHIPQDKELRNGGYRYVIAGKYICVYRLIAEMVYVYHIAHGASNYPTLFKRLLKEENQ